MLHRLFIGTYRARAYSLNIFFIISNKEGLEDQRAREIDRERGFERFICCDNELEA